MQNELLKLRKSIVLFSKFKLSLIYHNAQKMKIFTFLFLLSFPTFLSAQTQTVRGKVFDSETNFPLIGVKLSIQVNQTDLLRVLSNADGNLKLKMYQSENIV